MHNNISNKYIKAITWLFKCRSNANLSMKDVNLQKPMEHLFIMFSLFNYLLHITATVLIYVSIYIYISLQGVRKLMVQTLTVCINTQNKDCLKNK